MNRLVCEIKRSMRQNKKHHIVVNLRQFIPSVFFSGISRLKPHYQVANMYKRRPFDTAVKYTIKVGQTTCRVVNTNISAGQHQPFSGLFEWKSWLQNLYNYRKWHETQANWDIIVVSSFTFSVECNLLIYWVKCQFTQYDA